MRLEYDLDAGALYIRLAEGPVTQTREAGGNAAVDLGPDGRPVGIEVLSIDHSWPLDDILSAYDITEADATQLRAYFDRVAIMGQEPDRSVVPSLEAEPPVPVAVPAA
jgi:uncharacterized protein YuzE